MTVRMLINATVAEEVRVAITEDGELIDLDIESAEGSTIRGNIYKGVVHNVEGSLAAAFINFGAHKQGFLPFDEISRAAYCREPKKDERPRITDVLKRGQEIIVQAAKDAVGEKGAALTTHLSIPGKFTVLMPGSDAKGISRKIDDESARKKIRAMAQKISVPEDCGFIIRTAGLGQLKTAIQKDLHRLEEVWEKIQSAGKIARAPSLLHSEPNLIVRTLRDLFSEDIDEVLIDSRDEYEGAKEYFEEFMPQFVDRLQWYQNPIPIFTYYHVEPQVEATFERTVPLPGGGSIVIDETEALVAVDVNSGKMTSEGAHEDTVYKTNFEAAQVLAQQLRLRDLGGIVVVDLIDMELARNNRAVEKALRDALKDDKARCKMSRILANGLCILTRQRIRAGLRRTARQRCPACDGTGWMRSPESHSLSLLKRIEARLAQGGVEEARVSTHRATAEFLLNQKRSELVGLERQYQSRILIVAKAEMDRGSDEVKFLSKGELLAEITDQLPPREEPQRERRRGRKKKKAAAKKKVATTARARPEKNRSRRRGAPQVEEVPPEAGEPGGTTFTGKPPPELLAKVKAEAEARRVARVQREQEKEGPASEDLGRVEEAPDGMPPDSEPAEEPTWGSLVPGDPDSTPPVGEGDADRLVLGPSKEEDTPRIEHPPSLDSATPEMPPAAEAPPPVTRLRRAGSGEQPRARTSFLERLLGPRSSPPTDNEG